MTQYAHKSLNKDLNKFCDYMYGCKTPKTKRDIENFEASYFAMCLLLPKEVLLETSIVLCGSLKAVLENEDYFNSIAALFNVEPWLLKLRIDDILAKENYETLEQECKDKLVRKLTNN